jgi:1,4-dihydroxy-2-naphthoate octaprenyltransferase
MGGIIPMGSYFVFTGKSGSIFCSGRCRSSSPSAYPDGKQRSDIERDTASGRRTLPILLGAEKRLPA